VPVEPELPSSISVTPSGLCRMVFPKGEFLNLGLAVRAKRGSRRSSAAFFESLRGWDDPCSTQTRFPMAMPIGFNRDNRAGANADVRLARRDARGWPIRKAARESVRRSNGMDG